MTGPIHLTGPYRSGSTFAALLFGNHPEIGLGLHTTNWPRERVGKYDYGTMLGFMEAQTDALEYAERRWGLRASEDIKGAWTDGASEAWSGTMRTLGFGPRWMEKTNLEVGFQPTFLDWFPDGKAITVLRDPRSILASFREYTHHTDQTYLQAAFVALRSLQLATRYRDELPADRHHTLRYEDLATDTRAELKRGIHWLGLGWPGDDVMLSQDGWGDVPGSRWSDRSSFGRVDDDFDTDAAVHRWKGHLLKGELAFVEWVCWDAMQAWDYEPAHEERPYPLMFPKLVSRAWSHPGVAAMLDHWLETGEGTEAFPDDPEDSDTWREAVA